MKSTNGGSEFEDLILLNALGGSAQSVLFEAVRTELRASYRYGAGIDAFNQANRFLVMAGQVDAEKIPDVETIIRKVYTEFRQSGPTGSLADRKKPLIAKLKEGERDTGTMAFAALLAKLDGLSPKMVARLRQILDEVTDESVRIRANTALPAADELMVIVTSPDPEALPNACIITSPEQAADC